MSQILVCDHCKNQTDKEQLTRVIFKQRQKELARYDICDTCYKILLDRFNAKLLSGCQLDATISAPPISLTEQKSRVQAIEDGDVDPDMSIEKIGTVSGGPETIEQLDDDGRCVHFNKSPVKIGKDGPYQVCKSCNKRIPFRKLEQE